MVLNNHFPSEGNLPVGSSFVPASAGVSTLMRRYILSIFSLRLPSASNFWVARTCLERSNNLHDATVRLLIVQVLTLTAHLVHK
jgi:hypothetical protein